MSFKNYVNLIGNVGSKEVKALPNGDTIVNLSIATSEYWKDKQTGEKKEKTEWHRVVCFRQTADFVANYVHKGNKVDVTGKLQTRKWQGDDGTDRYTTEIVSNAVLQLTPKANQSDGTIKPSEYNGSANIGQGTDAVFDDDIPF